jgi:hypothetical protein
LCVELPSLGKALEKALAVGEFVRPSGFKRKSSTTVLPAFLYELFIKLFYKDGHLRPEACPKDVFALRQLTLMYYKYDDGRAITSEEHSAFIEQFAQRDNDVISREDLLQHGELLEHMTNIVADLLPDEPFDSSPSLSDGATADSFGYFDKRNHFRNIPALLDYIPRDLLFSNKRMFEIWKEKDLSPITVHSKVTTVPKDSRGPRIICMEPHERMYVQQGIMKLLYRHIEREPLTRGRINFTDQSINNRLAQLGSLDGSYVTVDLKEASDMVSWELVKQVFPDDWVAALSATRSPTVALSPDTIHTFKKFAPMGSALCFPIEAIIFWACCRVSCDEVYVYGDDIIMPSCSYERALKDLEKIGLIINKDKTLTTGFFRESCGGDFFKGADVGIIRIKTLGFESMIAYANAFRDRIGLDLSDKIIKDLESDHNDVVFRAPLSEKDNPLPYVYYTNFCSSSNVFFKRRWNRDIQIYEYRHLSYKKVSPSDSYIRELRQSYKTYEGSSHELVHKAKHNLLLDDDLAYVRWLATSNDEQPLESYRWTAIERLLGHRNLLMPKEIVEKPGPLKPRTKFNWVSYSYDIASTEV